MLGGSMRQKYFAPYSQYFLKFLKAYAGEGVAVQAVTVQNEVDTDQDGRMPAWDDRNSEIETDDGVNGDNKWSCQSCQQQISLFIPLPVIGRATPPHRHHSIDNLCQPVFGSVAKCRKIRN